MPPKGHAVLSASSSERWLNCPPSARLCEAYEEKSSDYAAEGTDAHALCEYRLKQALGIPVENPIENLSWYNEEMEDCATGYVAYVVELLEAAKQTCADPIVLIEQRVDFSRWVSGGLGTGDCICIAEGLLNIVDLKYGAGIEVSADHNPQMMLYALGALEIFDGIYDIDTVRMTIYQPRKSNISIFEMSKDVLLTWADTELTEKATVCSPNYYSLTDTGILALCWNSIQWSGTQYSVCAVFDIRTGTLLQSFVRETGTPYVLSNAPFFRVFFLSANTSPVATYLAFAKQNGQLLSLSKSRTFGLFAASPIQERGSHRYKLYATNSSNWLLYDYEGSLLT